MCGIWATLETGTVNSYDHVSSLELLHRRGPNKEGKLEIQIEGGGGEENVRLVLVGTLLWLRGKRPLIQPHSTKSHNVLLWNGDAYEDDLAEDDISDTEKIAEQLERTGDKDVPRVLAGLKGPSAYLYFRPSTKTLWFGRDIFGRHSLLCHVSKQKIVFCSVNLKQQALPMQEVPAVGVYEVNCLDYFTNKSHIIVHAWRDKVKVPFGNIKVLPTLLDSTLFARKNIVQRPFTNEDTADNERYFETYLSDCDNARRVELLTDHLSKAVQKRIEAQPMLCKRCLDLNACSHSKLGILFSGGLDSVVLTALADRILPEHEPIDLLNVAFEQVQKPLDARFDVPDRQTGIQALKELKAICGGTRTFNFVQINVTKSELVVERQRRISDLLYPLNTVLDDSIGCAVWFASRGQGQLLDGGAEYECPARVLLLGMGADEQFGGYSRHRARFQRDGLQGLAEEIRVEVDRISERNLGRDNRIVSDHGVAGRFPFLDENVVTFLESLPLADKMNLCLPRGIGDKLLLRAVAHKMGLHKTSVEPKRAIQFGSRIAKMENAKEKAHQVAVR